jgi:hypothetical protein
MLRRTHPVHLAGGCVGLIDRGGHVGCFSGRRSARGSQRSPRLAQGVEGLTGGGLGLAIAFGDGESSVAVGDARRNLGFEALHGEKRIVDRGDGSGVSLRPQALGGVCRRSNLRVQRGRQLHTGGRFDGSEVSLETIGQLVDRACEQVGTAGVHLSEGREATRGGRRCAGEIGPRQSIARGGDASLHDAEFGERGVVA